MSYYAITLFDPTTPSFVTASADYFGSDLMLKDFAANQDEYLSDFINDWLKTRDLNATYVYSELFAKEVADIRTAPFRLGENIMSTEMFGTAFTAYIIALLKVYSTTTVRATHGSAHTVLPA